MRLLSIVLIVVGVFASDTAFAPAAATVYTDRDAFEAAIGQHVTYTFDSSDGFPAAPADIATFGPATTASGSVVGPAAVARTFPDGSGNQTLSGVWGTFTSQLFVSLDPPQYSVGFDDYTHGIIGRIGVFFIGPGGAYTDSYGLATGPSSDASTFFGIISTDPITLISVRSDFDSRSQVYRGIDNFTLVPEPNAALLLFPVMVTLRMMRRFGTTNADRRGCHRSFLKTPIVDRQMSRFSPSFTGATAEPLPCRTLLSITPTIGGTASLSLGANINISQLEGNDAEEAIAIDPTNPGRMFAFSIRHEFDGAMLGMYSTNAGATWTASTAIVSTAHGDPSVAFDDFGHLFICWIDDEDQGSQVVMLAYSTDGGQTFSTAQQISPDVGDQPTVVTGPGADAEHGSVWVTYGVKRNPLVPDPMGVHWQVAARGAEVTRSTVGSFGSQQLIPFVSTYQNYGDIVVGPGGKVMVTFQDPSSGTGSDTIYVSVDEDGLGTTHCFSTPTAATATTIGAVVPIDAHARHGIDAEAGLAWDVNPASDYYDRIYLVYLNEGVTSGDDTDVFFRYSDDDGATWSDPVRVNADSTDRSQFLPRIAIDRDTGIIGFSWYDCRNDDGLYSAGLGGDTDGQPNNDAQIFAAARSDGGLTVLANIRVSAGTSNLGPTAGAHYETFNYGDYSGLAFVGGSLYPCWADNSNSTNNDNPDGAYISYDIYTARIIVVASSTMTLGLTGDDLDGTVNDRFVVALDDSGTYIQMWQVPLSMSDEDLPLRPTFTATRSAITSIAADGLTGTDRLTILVRHGTAATLDIATGSITAPNLVVTHSNIESRGFWLTGGSHVLATDNSSTSGPPLSFLISHSAEVTFQSDQHLDTLELQNTAKAYIQDPTSGTRTLNLSTLAVASGAAIDLNSNKLVADASTSTLLSHLAGLRSNGQITSSLLTINATNHPSGLYGTVLGIYDGTSAATFHYTILGDNNGDGTIDVTDLNNVLNNYGATTPSSFPTGDTNNDGVIDLADLNNVLNWYGMNVGDTL